MEQQLFFPYVLKKRLNIENISTNLTKLRCKSEAIKKVMIGYSQEFKKPDNELAIEINYNQVETSSR